MTGIVVEVVVEGSVEVEVLLVLSLVEEVEELVLVVGCTVLEDDVLLVDAVDEDVLLVDAVEEVLVLLVDSVVDEELVDVDEELDVVSVEEEVLLVDSVEEEVLLVDSVEDEVLLVDSVEEEVLLVDSVEDEVLLVDSVEEEVLLVDSVEDEVLLVDSVEEEVLLVDSVEDEVLLVDVDDEVDVVLVSMVERQVARATAVPTFSTICGSKRRSIFAMPPASRWQYDMSPPCVGSTMPA